MERVRSLRAPHQSFLLPFLAALVVGLVFAPSAIAQASSEQKPAVSTEDLKKVSGMFRQLGKLMEKMQGTVQYPPPRTQSHLLSLLPESTLLYAAFPNYGETSHQVLEVFRQDLKDDAELRAWWQKGDMATEGPKIEDGLDKFYQFSQYLGDEIAVAASSAGKGDPQFLLLAEVKKPGLKEFLRQLLKEQAGKTKPSAGVFDDAELAAAKNVPAGQPLILVRSDLVILAENLATLRRFTAHLDGGHKDFATTEFGQRMARSYDAGVTVLAGADLQAIFKADRPSKQTDATLQSTGFSDMKYAVLEHKTVAGQDANEVELSFTGPRRRVASWLAAPGPLGSLDFVSPKSVVVLSLLLKNGGQIFDDVRDLLTASNSNALASMTQMEQSMNMSFRDDVYAHLSGEITLEFDTPIAQGARWKVILKTNDPTGLLAIERKVFTALHFTVEEYDEDGVTFHTVRVPSAQSAQAIAYAVVDDYLIVAPSRELAAEAVRHHRSGDSLARSAKFQASLPPGHTDEMSGLLYQDSSAWAAMTLRQLSPEIAESFAQSRENAPPSVMGFYAEDTALREASRSGGMDTPTVLVVAAVAIPNLLRARVAANNASAVSSIRTANVAQISYSIAYPKRGFARDLASLGPNPDGSDTGTAEHANFIDASLGDASCTSGAWCTKSGYRFTLAAPCTQSPCKEYVVIGTPADEKAGNRSFCSTSDAVVRSKTGPPLTSAISAGECRKWAPVGAQEVNQNPPQ